MLNLCAMCVPDFSLEKIKQRHFGCKTRAGGLAPWRWSCWPHTQNRSTLRHCVIFLPHTAASKVPASFLWNLEYCPSPGAKLVFLKLLTFNHGMALESPGLVFHETAPSVINTDSQSLPRRWCEPRSAGGAGNLSIPHLP